jgi:hypothetical protein
MKRRVEAVFLGVLGNFVWWLLPGTLGLVTQTLASLSSFPPVITFVLALAVVVVTLLVMEHFKPELFRSNVKLAESPPAVRPPAAVPPSAPKPNPDVERAAKLLQKDQEIRNAESRGLLCLGEQLCYGWWRDASIQLELKFTVRNTWAYPITVENWGGKAKVYDNELPLPFDAEAHTVAPFSGHMFSAKIVWTPTQQEIQTHRLDRPVSLLQVNLQPVLNCLDGDGIKFSQKPPIQLTAMVHSKDQ